MAALVAQPAIVRDTTARNTSGSGKKCLFALAISDDIDTARNTERKLLIGYSLVFLQVLEPERRFTTLAVLRGQRPDLEGSRVDCHNQILVLRLIAAWSQLQRYGPRHRAFSVRGREVLDHVA